MLMFSKSVRSVSKKLLKVFAKSIYTFVKKTENYNNLQNYMYTIKVRKKYVAKTQAIYDRLQNHLYCCDCIVSDELKLNYNCLYPICKFCIQRMGVHEIFFRKRSLY